MLHCWFTETGINILIQNDPTAWMWDDDSDENSYRYNSEEDGFGDEAYSDDKKKVKMWEWWLLRKWNEMNLM